MSIFQILNWEGIRDGIRMPLVRLGAVRNHARNQDPILTAKLEHPPRDSAGLNANTVADLCSIAYGHCGRNNPPDDFHLIAHAGKVLLPNKDVAHPLFSFLKLNKRSHVDLSHC